MSTEYHQFVASKLLRDSSVGFDAVDLNAKLFAWQQDLVRWACQRGKAALFADCGLGKTAMQLEYSRLVVKHTGQSVLILAPLNVVEQTCREGAKFGIEVQPARSQEDVPVEPCVVVTNYEMLEHFDPASFAGVVLDESSILKSFTGRTKRMLCDLFQNTPFRLCCTATPAPNDHKELGNHADFLGVMPSNEMLARWFVNDPMQAGNYRLKGHAEDDFWRWVTSWAASCGAPSDLGYSDEGFVLPELEVIQRTVDTPPDAAFRIGSLFAGESLSATCLWQDKRETLSARVAEVAALVASEPSEPWIVWCSTDYEADALVAALPECVEVRGSQSRHVKSAGLLAFSSGAARVIVTKPGVAGLGLNWQHCARQVFASLTYSFEDLYQAVRRSYRFGQTRPVRVYIVTAETEGNIVQTVDRKQKEHDKMKRQMCGAMRKHGLVWRGGMEYSQVQHEEAEGGGWKMALGDSITYTAAMEADSVDLIVHSPPFVDLYIYSDSIADLGNSDGDVEFFKHYDYLIKELHRVTRPGRLCCVHCKDLPLYKNRDGAAGLYDFPGAIIAAFEDAGWTFHSRVTVWKDPVIEMQRTKNHGLLWKNFSARREVVRVGMADFVLCFRKWTSDMEDCQVTDKPIPGDYIGDNPPLQWDSERDWSIQMWQKYASPVWMDIRQTNVLPYAGGRDERDERHICPLQLDVIERLVWLYSNRGELVYDPFGGVGSTPYVATKMGRRGLGCELKRSYWEQACANLRSLDEAAKQRSLFQ